MLGIPNPVSKVQFCFRIAEKLLELFEAFDLSNIKPQGAK